MGYKDYRKPIDFKRFEISYRNTDSQNRLIKFMQSIQTVHDENESDLAKGNGYYSKNKEEDITSMTHLKSG